MKHLIRAGGIIIAIIIMAFALPKAIPFVAVEGLQKYGFYSKHDNTEEWKTLPVQYADPILCNSCHEDKHSVWTAGPHRSVSCENCHGPGERHIVEGVSLVTDPSKQLCESCHAEVLGRPVDFPQIDIEQHGNQAACINCHNPHAPYIPAIAHKVEGYDDCLLCHKSGGLKPFPENHQGRGVDSCLTCHNVT